VVAVKAPAPTLKAPSLASALPQVIPTLAASTSMNAQPTTVLARLSSPAPTLSAPSLVLLALLVILVPDMVQMDAKTLTNALKTLITALMMPTAPTLLALSLALARTATLATASLALM
jgi:hypothetical protein